jgi:hypothetical protein
VYTSYLRSYCNVDVIDDLSKLGTIAGGSTLYCFDPENLQVNDIDLFVGSIENLRKAVEIIKINFTVEKYTQCGAVLEIYVENNPKFQIVMLQDGNVDFVLNNFDLDYVRCGYFNEQFYATDEMMNAFNNKQISVYKGLFVPMRLDKAVEKGFKLSDDLQFVHNLNKDTPRWEAEFKEISEEQVKHLKFMPLINGTNYYDGHCDMARTYLNSSQSKCNKFIVDKIGNFKEKGLTCSYNSGSTQYEFWIECGLKEIGSTVDHINIDLDYANPVVNQLHNDIGPVIRSYVYRHELLKFGISESKTKVFIKYRFEVEKHAGSNYVRSIILGMKQ